MRRIETFMDAKREADAKEEADLDDAEASKTEAAITEGNDNSEEAAKEDVRVHEQPAPEQALAVKTWNEKLPWNQDLHTQSMHESKRAAEIWEEQEKFDEKTEYLFNYVQVFTACLNSFAHGANDISNTLAPLSAIIQLYQTGVVDKNATVPKWILAYAGLSLVIGFLLYGYRVLKSIGFKLTMLSPSRGACAELGSSLTVVTASFLSIPVSTTQCIVGAVTAVGCVGGRFAVQWLFLLKVCCGWAVLFVCCVILSAGIFSFAAYSPQLNPPSSCYNATYCY
jgi:phosphate/sulfate permease